MISEETKKATAEFFKRTIKDSKKLAKEMAGDVKKKTNDALGIWDDEGLHELIGYARKQLIKDRGITNAAILKGFKNKVNKKKS